MCTTFVLMPSRFVLKNMFPPTKTAFRLMGISTTLGQLAIATGQDDELSDQTSTPSGRQGLRPEKVYAKSRVTFPRYGAIIRVFLEGTTR